MTDEWTTKKRTQYNRLNAGARTSPNMGICDVTRIAAHSNALFLQSYFSGVLRAALKTVFS